MTLGAPPSPLQKNKGSKETEMADVARGRAFPAGPTEGGQADTWDDCKPQPPRPETETGEL